MLKIKDDVDLKELEKLGFKECYDYFYFEKARLQDDLCVNKKTRTLSMFSFIGDIYGRKRDRRTRTLIKIEKIKELITAGLVEKSKGGII